MDIFKKALSSFVEFDQKQKVPEHKQSEHATGVVYGNVGTPVSSGFSTPLQQPVQVNQNEIEKFTKHFEDLMDSANLPGHDYYEFLKVAQKLEHLIIDEKTRLTSAFASLSVQGLTKDILINSANKYIDIIEKDKEGFDDALKQKIDKEIGSRKSQIDNAQSQIEANNQKIQELAKQITTFQTQIQDLKKQCDEVETTIRKNTQSFSIAHDAIVNTIKTDIQKIQSII